MRESQRDYQAAKRDAYIAAELLHIESPLLMEIPADEPIGASRPAPERDTANKTGDSGRENEELDWDA